MNLLMKDGYLNQLKWFLSIRASKLQMEYDSLTTETDTSSGEVEEALIIANELTIVSNTLAEISMIELDSN